MELTFQSSPARPVSSPARQLKDRLAVACIDIEGRQTDPVELAVWIFYEDTTQPGQAFHYFFKPADAARVAIDAKYSHGLSRLDMELTKGFTDKSRALRSVRSLLAKVPRLVVCSADENPNSDVAGLVADWGLPYVNVPLEKWKTRGATPEHQRSVEARHSGCVWLEEAHCPYAEAHSVPLIKERSAAEALRLADGPHCALADVLELGLVVKSGNWWGQFEEALGRYSRM